MSNPASLGIDIPLPYRIRSSNEVKDALDANKAMLDALNVLANRLAPTPFAKKYIIDLGPEESLTVDLGSGQTFNSIQATVTDGNLNIYFAGTIGSTFDVQFAAGNPAQVFYPQLQQNQLTFFNPSLTGGLFAIVWVMQY